MSDKKRVCVLYDRSQVSLVSPIISRLKTAGDVVCFTDGLKFCTFANSNKMDVLFVYGSGEAGHLTLLASSIAKQKSTKVLFMYTRTAPELDKCITVLQDVGNIGEVPSMRAYAAVKNALSI